MTDFPKPQPSNSQVTWLQGGAALSLAWLAWSLLRRRRLAARIALSIAASCLGRIGDLRLQARVSDLLARAEDSDGQSFNPVDSWRLA
jgi:hypothetical protein